MCVCVRVCVCAYDCNISIPCNDYSTQYLMWRVLTGLHKRMTLSFMMVGHTKFSPDWCFGLIKQKWRKSVVGCLDDLADTVNRSAAPNVAQLVGR